MEYFHIELDRHEIVFAEGLAAESYLDVGHRAAFESADAPMVLHPTFVAIAHEAARAPLVLAGPRVETVRARLAARAAATQRRRVG